MSGFDEIREMIAEFTPDAWEILLRHQAAKYDMPPVPTDRVPCMDVVYMKPFSGIYFEWHGIFVTYVGMSIDVPRRLKSHKKVEHSSLVSFIQASPDKLPLMECFYIWLLAPEKNSQSMAAAE